MAWLEHRLEELGLPLNGIKEALECLLHSILFIRLPGSVQPSEVTGSLYPITYAHCNVPQVTLQVENTVLKLQRILERQNEVVVIISFFERQVQKSLFGLMSNEAKLYWEHWVLPLRRLKSETQGGTNGKKIYSIKEKGISFLSFIVLEPTLERQRQVQQVEVALQKQMIHIITTAQVKIARRIGQRSVEI